MFIIKACALDKVFMALSKSVLFSSDEDFGKKVSPDAENLAESWTENWVESWVDNYEQELVGKFALCCS